MESVRSRVESQIVLLSLPYRNQHDAQAWVSCILQILDDSPSLAPKVVASSFQASTAGITTVLRLSDCETDMAGVLKPAALSAKLLSALTRIWDLDYTVRQLLQQEDGLGLAASSLMLKDRLRPSTENKVPETPPWWALDLALRARHGILNSPGDPIRWSAAVRLLALLVSTFWPTENRPDVLTDVFATVVLQANPRPSAQRVAILHLIKAFCENLDSNLPSDRLKLFGRPLHEKTLEIIRDTKEAGAVRAFALHVCGSITGVLHCVDREWVENISSLCVDVILWGTTWQHDLTEQEVSPFESNRRPAFSHLPLPAGKLRPNTASSS